MKKIVITLCLAAFVLAAKAGAGAYTVNDHQIETVFAQSTPVSLASLSQTGSLAMANALGSNATTMTSADAGGKNFATALILNFFLGGLGIHRLYLGTKTLTWVGYILTCGGIFGIVPLVDFIVLIVHNQDISPYVNNPSFFMWGGGNM